MTSDSALPLVAAGVAAAERFGINSTPTVMLNGHKYARTPSADELLQAIDSLLTGRVPYKDQQGSSWASK